MVHERKTGEQADDFKEWCAESCFAFRAKQKATTPVKREG